MDSNVPHAGCGWRRLGTWQTNIFLERLSQQLHDLLGVKPFITRKGEHVSEDALVYEFMYYSRDDWVKLMGPLDSSGRQLHWADYGLA